MLAVRILITGFMIMVWAMIMLEGWKKPWRSHQLTWWIVGTLVCGLIVFRTWECPGLPAACWP